MKKIMTKLLLMSLIISALGFLTVVISKKILVSNETYTYDNQTIYSCMEVEVPTIPYDKADLIAEIEIVGNRKQYEKNIVMEAVITHVLKKDVEKGATVIIVEPMVGFNGYIPLKEGQKYHVLLKQNTDFDFETYKMIGYYKPNAKFYEYDLYNADTLEKVMEYDYQTSKKQEYENLEKYLMDNGYLIRKKDEL